MDVPKLQENTTDLFDRVKREMPEFQRIRSFEQEVALETSELEGQYQWIGIRPRQIGSGFVNPEYIELTFGFDLPARENRNAIVMQSLYGNSPLSSIASDDIEPLLDVQPRIGFALNEACDLQAFVEVKTRTSAVETATQIFQDEPISVYLTVRKNGPIDSVESFLSTFGRLAGHIEHIAENRVIPDVVVPLHQAIGI